MLKTSTISTQNFFENASKKVIFGDDRKNQLLKIAETIAKIYSANEVVNLTYIGTFNARTSLLAQVWSFYAAHYFKLNIDAFSGGTEVTACNRNTVKTLQKVGFTFQLEDFKHQNPTYQISFSGTKKYILGFSKLYDHLINTAPFVAIALCTKAKENMPSITAASHLFYLGFSDLKLADNLDQHEEIYLKTSKQIAGEIFVIFKEVKKLLS